MKEEEKDLKSINNKFSKAPKKGGGSVRSQSIQESAQKAKVHGLMIEQVEEIDNLIQLLEDFIGLMNFEKMIDDTIEFDNELIFKRIEDLFLVYELLMTKNAGTDSEECFTKIMTPLAEITLSAMSYLVQDINEICKDKKP